MLFQVLSLKNIGECKYFYGLKIWQIIYFFAIFRIKKHFIVMDVPILYCLDRGLAAGHITSLKQQRVLVILDLNHAMRATHEFVVMLT